MARRRCRPSRCRRPARIPRDYHAPLQDFLINYEIDTGTRRSSRTIPPSASRSPTWCGRSSATPCRPTRTRSTSAFGYGWWKQNIAAADELLTAAGFTKNGNQWMMPDGHAVHLHGEVPHRRRDQPPGRRSSPSTGRRTACRPRPKSIPTSGTACALGDYEVNIAWAVETWGGHPDLSFFLDSYHSPVCRRARRPQPARNWMRWTDPRLDEIIEKIRGIDFNDHEADSNSATTSSSCISTKCRTSRSCRTTCSRSVEPATGPAGRPPKNPYANPVTNWSNAKYIFTQIKPVRNKPPGDRLAGRSERRWRATTESCWPIEPGGPLRTADRVDVRHGWRREMKGYLTLFVGKRPLQLLAVIFCRHVRRRSW